MSAAEGQVVPGDGGVRGYMSAGANYASFGIRGLWLIFVYWGAISLAVMILGAHQFHLKVAASASANPGSTLTIGELIREWSHYRALQDAIETLELERRNKVKEIAQLEESRFAARARFDGALAEAYSAARNLAAMSAHNLKDQAPWEWIEWARAQPRRAETQQLDEEFARADQRLQVADAGYLSARDRVQTQIAAKKDLDGEIKGKSGELSTFLTELRKNKGAGNGTNGNSSNVIGLLYELDSFRNLGFFWFGEIDPLKFVTLPGSVLTLLLALAMGALGSTLFVTGEYFRSNGTRPMAWYFFRPFLGMITALAVFVAFKAGQLTMAGVSPNSGVEMDLNPFLVSFFAVIAGLLSEHAIARLSLIGRDWLNRIGKDSKPDAAPDAAAKGPAALYAKDWETHFAAGSGKSVEGLVAALRADPARVEAWMSHREPVPVEVHEELVKYFGLTKDEILAPGDR